MTSEKTNVKTRLFRKALPVLMASTLTIGLIPGLSFAASAARDGAVDNANVQTEQQDQQGDQNTQANQQDQQVDQNTQANQQDQESSDAAADASSNGDHMFEGIPQPYKDYNPEHADFSIDPNGAYHWKLKNLSFLTDAFYKMYSKNIGYLVDHDTVIDLNDCCLKIRPALASPQYMTMFQIANNGNLTIFDSSAKKENLFELEGTDSRDRRLVYIPGDVTTNPQVTINDIKVMGGQATTKNKEGGVIKAEAGTVTLSGKTFLHLNRGNYGGNVFVSGPNTHFIMKDSAAIEGSVHSYAGTDTKFGGGVYVKDGATFTLTDNATIREAETDESPDQGGGVYVNNAKFEMTGGTIKDCEAARGGAVLLNDGSTMTMTGGCIKGCEAEYGGGVYVASGERPSTFNMQGGTIQNCKGTKMCGNVWVEGPTGGHQGSAVFNMSGGELKDGKGSSKGGNVYNAGNTTISGSLTGGSATDGGNIYNEDTVTVDGGSIAGGTAAHGGGIACYNGVINFKGDARLENCAANRNGAHGGGVYVNNGGLNMYGGQVAGCKATRGGGVMLANGATMYMVGGSVEACEAEYGGGVYASADEPCTFIMENASVHSCKAGKEGGGVWMEGAKKAGNLGSQLIMNSGASITGNSASSGAGGVHFLSGENSFRIEGNPIVKGNTRGNVESDVKLVGENRIFITGPLAPGASIGIDQGVQKGQSFAVTGANRSDYSSSFFANDPNAKICKGAGNTVEVRWVPETRVDGAASATTTDVDKVDAQADVTKDSVDKVDGTSPSASIDKVDVTSPSASIDSKTATASDTAAAGAANKAIEEIAN